MTRTSSATERPCDLPDVATVSTEDAPVVSFGATLVLEHFRGSVPLPLVGLRLGRGIGLGLGGGLS